MSKHPPPAPTLENLTTVRIFLVLLTGALSAPAAAQPLPISASVAVTWLNPISAPANHVGENPPSLGIVSHPALVVLWRGQPGWKFRGDTGPLEAVSFEGSSGAAPDGERHHSIAVMHGGIRLELEYGPRGRTAQVNGVPVLLPDEHDVILLDNVDVELEVARTLSLGGEASEPVETFLGRSPEIREFMRCDLPLPEDVFLVNEADPEIAGQLREYVQTILDERCLLLLGE